jgi:hypothetical protein
MTIHLFALQAQCTIENMEVARFARLVDIQQAMRGLQEMAWQAMRN